VNKIHEIEPTAEEADYYEVNWRHDDKSTVANPRDGVSAGVFQGSF
jgi:hypothetical protein